MRLLFTILLLSAICFGQDRNGISYQALILNPTGEPLPGKDNDNTPLDNTDICLKFYIINSSGNYEYSELQTVKTDAYGMVNLVVGTGQQVGALTWDAVVWSPDAKYLRVDIDFSGTCTRFSLLSSQKLNFTPFSYYALNSKADALVDSLQSDVDQNESDSDTADTTLQTNIDAVQSDVDQNESDSDTADTTLQANIDAVQSDVDANETAFNTALNLKANLASPSFTGTPLATTASAGTSTTQIATTAFVNNSVSTGISGLAPVREVADEFSATSGQTSFSLTQAPSTNSKVRMYINGIRISNTAYGISGNTLTYDPSSNGNYSLNTSDRIQFDYYY